VDAREGELPPSLATHPQKQQQHQESLVVYTEDWTDPFLPEQKTKSANPAYVDQSDIQFIVCGLDCFNWLELELLMA
jgi:hypothetical protein